MKVEQNVFSIEGVVVEKTAILKHSEGKYFVVTLKNRNGRWVRCSCFNEIVTKFYDRILKNKIYVFSNITPRIVNSISLINRKVGMDVLFNQNTEIKESCNQMNVKDSVTMLSDLNIVIRGFNSNVCVVIVKINEITKIG